MPILRQIGLGEALKITLGKIPLPSAAKQKMAGCGGCKRRAAKLDALVPNINPFAAKPSPPVMQPPEVPPAP